MKSVTQIWATLYFRQGSLKIGEGIKLFIEHDMTRPIGKLASYKEDDEKIIGTFKIARTNSGDDALAEAQEGLEPDLV